jgi:selenium-binding protein 1
VIEIPAEPTDSGQLVPLLNGFRAAPPLITDIHLSVDDHVLYISSWATSEFQQHDVSDPLRSKLTGSVHLDGVVRLASHPSNPQAAALNDGPRTLEIGRDDRSIYFTNPFYVPLDDQCYLDGVRSHQVQLEGGDASPDSYFYP